VNQGRSILDVPVGKRTRFSKTVSESDVYLFAGITGDLDPNHVDEEYTSKTSMGGRVAHGALILGYTSAASTRILEDFERPMVSVGYEHVRFLKPVRLGDTITVDYVITSVVPERERIISRIEVTNQRGEPVCVAEHIMQLVD
jgi:3-hydroxybutyryl-CoA dehydratase